MKIKDLKKLIAELDDEALIFKEHGDHQLNPISGEELTIADISLARLGDDPGTFYEYAEYLENTSSGLHQIKALPTTLVLHL